MRTLPVVLFLLFPFSALRAREPAEKVALVQTLEELAQRPPIRLSTGWEVRLGLSDGVELFEVGVIVLAPAVPDNKNERLHPTLGGRLGCW